MLARVLMLCAITVSACGPSSPPLALTPETLPVPSTHDAGPVAEPTRATSSDAFTGLARAIASREDGHVWLTSYREDRGEVKATCRAFASNEAAALLEGLAHGGVFESVRLLEMQELEGPIAEMTFTARLRDRSRSLVVESPDAAASLLGPGVKNPFDHVEPTPPAPQTLAEDSDASALVLTAIVTGERPRAMLVDRAKKGIIVQRGDLLGRATCRYRVDQIRESEIVLEKADAAACAKEPASRVIAIRK